MQRPSKYSVNHSSKTLITFPSLRLQLKSGILMSLEDSEQLSQELSLQALNSTQVVSPKELSAAVDSVTMNDLNQVVSRVMKSKVAIASLGQIHNVPVLEELV